MTRRIVIAVVTRNRPLMLRELFDSLQLMNMPETEHVEFLIVENNERPTLGSTISLLQEQFENNPVHYLLENQIGIAAARNCALDYASTMDFDLLAFVDDDEFVHDDWLIELLNERDRLDFDIVGSPVRPVPENHTLTFSQRLVCGGLLSKSLKSEHKYRDRYHSKGPNSVQLATGSWLGKVSFFRETGVRFDTKLGRSGGEDWDLWKRSVRAQAKTGWAVDAIVFETVPTKRLQFSYFYRRNRDHNASKIRLALIESPLATKMQLPAKIVGRVIKLIAVVLVAPVCGSAGLLSVVTAAGGVMALFLGCTGKLLEHYKKTTGY